MFFLSFTFQSSADKPTEETLHLVSHVIRLPLQGSHLAVPVGPVTMDAKPFFYSALVLSGYQIFFSPPATFEFVLRQHHVYYSVQEDDKLP